MYSMTGFGKGEATTENNIVFTAEISSVNRRQLDIRTNLPTELSAFDTLVRGLITNRISRGAVMVRVNSSSGNFNNSDVELNLPLLEKLASDCLELCNKLKIVGGIDIASLVSLPGVIISSSIDTDDEKVQETFTLALERALESFIKMRQQEGEVLKQDLELRFEKLKNLHKQIYPHTGEIKAQLRQRLLERLENEDLLQDPNDDRVLREILFYTDRSDVTEELTRLKSHFEQFEKFLNITNEPVGRSLDFLMQEMFREINTLGNKVGSSEVSHIVVDFKTELEKIREQVQNIE